MAKEYQWCGKNEEEIKKLDFKTFLELIPARRRRTLQRMDENKKILLKKVQRGDINIKTHCRDMVILPSMLGKTIKVYNGKEYFPVMVDLDMLGHCLGEFALTRKFVTHSAAGVGATKSSRAISAR